VESLHQKWVPWLASLLLHGSLLAVWNLVPLQEEAHVLEESLPWVVSLYSLPLKAQATLPAEPVLLVENEAAPSDPLEKQEKTDRTPETIISPKVSPPEPFPPKSEPRVPQKTPQPLKVLTPKLVAKKSNTLLHKIDKTHKVSPVTGRGKTGTKKFSLASQVTNSPILGDQVTSGNQTTPVPTSGEENQRSQRIEDRSEEESTPISYRNNPRPAYPLIAKRLGQEGVARFLVTVRMDGTPTVIRLKNSSGYPVLDAAAREAIAQWRFEPARRGGRAYESTTEVPVRFRMLD